MPSKTEINDELILDRLCRAPSLRRMEKGRELLAFTVQHSMPDGDPRQLSEESIGKAIYGPHYNSLESPKVRTGMGRLLRNFARL